MIDGNKITSVLAGTLVTHLSLMVKAGRVYKVQPPLYKIVKNGKEIFIRDNREYAEYILNEISKNILIKGVIGKQKTILSNEDVVDLIVNTKKYYKKLDKLSKHLLIEKELLEFVIININYLRENNLDKFEKIMRNKFKQFKLKKKSKNDYYIKGIYKREAEFIKINESFYRKIEELEDFINNMPYIYYDVEDKEYQLAELLELFKSYEPKNKQRYKGLGEMKPIELKERVLTPGKRNLIRLTMEDLEKSIKQFDILHNEKAAFRAERSKLLDKFKIDPDELDC